MSKKTQTNSKCKHIDRNTDTLTLLCAQRLVIALYLILVHMNRKSDVPKTNILSLLSIPPSISQKPFNFVKCFYLIFSTCLNKIAKFVVQAIVTKTEKKRYRLIKFMETHKRMRR